MKRYDNNYTFTLVETEGQLNRFYTESAHVGWLAFDTEFIPEKYYKYKLCVISASTSRGNYIIDVLKLKNIAPFIKIIEDPATLKITHAGENDYQLLVNDHDARPRNVFDTQLSYGFLQYDYPVGLQPLLSKVLRIKLDKGALRSDWERRPLSNEQCRYAVQDVVHLHPLMLAIKRRLKNRGKLDWALQENQRLEDSDFYRNDPLDFMNSAGVNQLSNQERAFLLRMHMWRHLEAEKENRPVTQVLKTGVLNTIVQKISVGDSALLKDRTLPNRFIRENLDTFKRMYHKKVSHHEKELMDRIPEVSTVSSRAGLLMDILHQLLKYKGLQQGISPKMIISAREMQLMKAEPDYFPAGFKVGWRTQLLGKDLLKLLENRGDFDVSIKKNKFTLKMKSKSGQSIKRFFSKLRGPRDTQADSE
ncbi:MAG: hypothetical protein GY950_10285 [bacterium]|nr:hypothetical protein [bacterium]